MTTTPVETQVVSENHWAIGTHQCTLLIDNRVNSALDMDNKNIVGYSGVVQGVPAQHTTVVIGFVDNTKSAVLGYKGLTVGFP